LQRLTLVEHSPQYQRSAVRRIFSLLWARWSQKHALTGRTVMLDNDDI
jgi:hypothetical protein